MCEWLQSLCLSLAALPEWSSLSTLSGLSHCLKPPKPEAYTLNPLDLKHDICMKKNLPLIMKTRFEFLLAGGGGGGGGLPV